MPITGIRYQAYDAKQNAHKRPLYAIGIMRARLRMRQRFSILLSSRSTASRQPLKPAADEAIEGWGGMYNAHALDSIDFRLAGSSFGVQGRLKALTNNGQFKAWCECIEWSSLKHESMVSFY